MPHVVLPDGPEKVKIVKVTAAEKRAVDEYNRDKTVKSALENPAIPLAIAALSVGGIAGFKLVEFLKTLTLPSLPDLADIAEDTAKAVVDAAVDKVTDPFLVNTPEEKRKFATDALACWNANPIANYPAWKGGTIGRNIAVTNCLRKKGHTLEIIGEFISGGQAAYAEIITEGLQ